jgi:hypothetical protein
MIDMFIPIKLGVGMRRFSALFGPAPRSCWLGIVTPRLLQKGISENFDFHVTLRHRQSYKLTAEYIFLTITH